jgi:hypothetical protein
MGLPVFFPNDPAIPAPAIPAQANLDRAFLRDKKNLQREQKPGVSGVLTTGAYLGVALIWFGMLAALAWGLVRLARHRGGPPRTREGRARAPGRGEPVPTG